MENPVKKPVRNIYQKLGHVQLNLKAPKSQYNKFGNFNYRNCEDIQEAAKPLMNDIGAVLIINDELVQIGDRFYIKATARFIDTDSGEVIENTAYAREELEKKGMDASQVTGSTSSYARKYALNGLFCIDDTEDSDTPQAPDSQETAKNRRKAGKEEGHKPQESGRPSQAALHPELAPEYINTQQINTLFMEVKRTGISEQMLLDAAHVDDLHKLTRPLYDGLMRRLKATPDKPKEDYSVNVPPEGLDDSGLPWNTPMR